MAQAPSAGTLLGQSAAGAVLYSVVQGCKHRRQTTGSLCHWLLHCTAGTGPGTLPIHFITRGHMTRINCGDSQQLSLYIAVQTQTNSCQSMSCPVQQQLLKTLIALKGETLQSISVLISQPGQMALRPMLRKAGATCFIQGWPTQPSRVIHSWVMGHNIQAQSRRPSLHAQLLLGCTVELSLP